MWQGSEFKKNWKKHVFEQIHLRRKMQLGVEGNMREILVTTYNQEGIVRCAKRVISQLIQTVDID